MAYPHDDNRNAWDTRAHQNMRFTKVASAEDIASKSIRRVDRMGWLGDSIAGKTVLCLGAGGGRHGIVYDSLGARTTVVDISQGMLDLDRKMNKKYKASVRCVQASMDHMPTLEDQEFDVVIHPVSTCYLPDLKPVYQEIARVTKPGGLYISQHKQPVSMQADTRKSPLGYELITDYYYQGPLPQVKNSLHREEGTQEFLHRWEDLVGLMCRAGFVIQDLMEPRHGQEGAELGSFEDRSLYVPPYVKIKAQRASHSASPSKSLNTVILP